MRFLIVILSVCLAAAQETTTITGTVSGILTQYRLVQFVVGTANVQSMSSTGGALGISTLNYTPGQTALVVTSGPYVCEFIAPPAVGNVAVTSSSSLCVDSGTTAINMIPREQGVVGRILALVPSACANCALVNVLGPTTFGGLYSSSSLSGAVLTSVTNNQDGTVTYLFSNGSSVTATLLSRAGFFGSGADGDLLCSTSNLTSGPLTSGSLTRDAYWSNVTIQPGCSINTAGYRVFVSGTLDISNAPALAFRGNALVNGTGATTAAGGAGATGYTGVSVSGIAAGGAGGAGTTTTGAQAAAASAGNNGGASGAGGAGGSGVSAGGASRAGAIVTPRGFSRVDANVLSGATLISAGAVASAS